METKKRFVEDDSFDGHEALTAAFDIRKFLLKRMLEDRQHFSGTDDDVLGVLGKHNTLV